MTFTRVVGLLSRFFFEGFRPIARAPYRPDPASWPDTEITGAWLGHSTVLLNLFGVWIITDPVLATRCGLRFGPLTIGPRRFVRPALDVRDLPEIDLLLLSHAHMDHLDLRTLRRLPGQPHAVTADGLSDLLEGMPFSGVTELGWDESATIETPHGPILVTARQVAHWGARMRTDVHRGYNGYLIEAGRYRVVFGGDTAYTETFRGIRSAKPVDLAIMPIGAYDPWIHAHCNPEQALRMADQAGADFVLPVHHQTFQLSSEPYREPIKRLLAATGSDQDRVATREIGDEFRLDAGSRQTSASRQTATA